MKSLAKSTLYGLYKYTGAMAVQERLAYWSGRRFMSVVLFHRVTDAIPEDGLTVSTAWFRGFCKLMRDRFHVVSLATLHRMLMTGQTPPLRTVAITFDDCYRDNLAAARVLALHRLPATFFIPTKYVGTDHVFPWDTGLTQMPNLTWQHVKEMQDLGHEIGSHTVSHPDLGVISPAKARREMADSKKTLEDKLQRPVRWFAYPFGGRGNFRPEYLPLTRELGYDACFSAVSGFIQPHLRGQILPREAMPYFRSLLNLELHLSGCLDWFYGMKRRVGLLSL
ncbi:MAG: polysaccharide deacetylase family protein [Planctomycetes bacterium]|nr:polysaccharide deacetylase family protein [Planctomycetota bacterium]